jgi:multidrug efflux pump subunit AcrA (membrane-fusion protein)
VVNGVVEKRNVTIGASDGEYVEVSEGIKEGEEVITVVTGDITEGMSVITTKGDTINMEEIDAVVEE